MRLFILWPRYFYFQLESQARWAVFPLSETSPCFSFLNRIYPPALPHGEGRLLSHEFGDVPSRASSMLSSNHERVIFGYSRQNGSLANPILAAGKSHTENAGAGAAQCIGTHTCVDGSACKVSTSFLHEMLELRLR